MAQLVVLLAYCRFELIPWSEVEKRLSKRRDEAIGDSQTYRQDHWRPTNKAGYTGESFNYGGAREPNRTHAKDTELSRFRRERG